MTIDKPVGSTISTHLAQWRRGEERFFRSVMGDPDLYMAAIRLVRALADRVGEGNDLDGLVRRFDREGVEEVRAVVEELGVPQLILLDHALARRAAYCLAAQAWREEQSRAVAASRLSEAREAGEEWVVLWRQDEIVNGHTFFERLEVHVPTGHAVRASHWVDMEKGWIWAMQPTSVDPESGRQINEATRQERLEFSSREDLERALHRLRADWSEEIPES